MIALRKKILFFIVWGVLFFPFYNNLFKTVDSPNFFNTFQDGNQSLVIARMAIADQKGLFYKALFLGRCFPVAEKCNGNDTPCAKAYQKEILFKKLPIDYYSIYKSHPGFHALFYSSIYKLLGESISPEKKLDIIYLIIALINSFIIALLIIMIFYQYGVFVVSFITIFSILNLWLVCFGNELMMFIGILLIPLLLLWSLYSHSAINNIPSWKKILVVAIGIIIKVMFTGFEFISCSLFMVSIPILYFALENKWRFKVFMKEAIWISLGIFIGMSLMFLLIAIQIKIAEDSSISDGFNYLMERFVLRTTGENTIPPEQLKLRTILNQYFNTYAIRQRWIGVEISFKSLVLCHIISSFMLLIFKQFKNITITSWLAFLVSISWLVLFRQHSAVHTHINPIIWYLPYMFFAYAIIALSIQVLFNKSFNWMMLRLVPNR